MADLAERITAAINHAEQAATAFADRYGWEATNEWITFAALNDPAAVLRRCTADRRVLERHPSTGRPFNECIGCGYTVTYGAEPELREEWPCPEIRDLADRYGIQS